MTDAAMAQWYAEAGPQLEPVVETLGLLARASRGPIRSASTDQIAAAVRQFNAWIQEHPCPNGHMGASLIDNLTAVLLLCLGFDQIVATVGPMDAEIQVLGIQAQFAETVQLMQEQARG